MSSQKRKQMAALVKLREHKERIARSNLQSEIDDLKRLHVQAEAKNDLVAELTADLYMGLESRLLNNQTIVDPGARFTTFAMSVNAARENLILEEALAAQLQDDLKMTRGGIAIYRENLKVAYQKLQKAQHISEDLKKDRRRQDNRADESNIEEMTNSRFVAVQRS